MTQLLAQLKKLKANHEARAEKVGAILAKLEEIFRETLGEPEAWQLLNKALRQAGIDVTPDETRKFVDGLAEKHVDEPSDIERR